MVLARTIPRVQCRVESFCSKWGNHPMAGGVAKSLMAGSRVVACSQGVFDSGIPLLSDCFSVNQ